MCNISNVKYRMQVKGDDDGKNIASTVKMNNFCIFECKRVSARDKSDVRFSGFSYKYDF